MKENVDRKKEAKRSLSFRSIKDLKSVLIFSVDSPEMKLETLD